jgi:Amt family ammonium transporter
MIYQLMFAIITPALMTGAFAERMKFKTFLVFSLLWATFIYDPLAHGVWGAGGWLRTRGALDFAGGTVVHISSGVSALIAVLIMGKRVGYGVEPTPPHNLPLTVIGASLLWVGWFGFNAGSAVAANGLAVSAFVATNTAAAAATLAWMFAEWIIKGKPTMLGAAREPSPVSWQSLRLRFCRTDVIDRYRRGRRRHLLFGVSGESEVRL